MSHAEWSKEEKISCKNYFSLTQPTFEMLGSLQSHC